MDVPTPPERVDDEHKEIDERIRTMATIAFVLAAVAFLITLCCIVSWILMTIDIHRDRTTEVFVPLPTLPNDTGPTNCDDENSCTIDLERVIGGCDYCPLPTGTLCTSRCFDTISAPLACELVEVQKGVEVPKCMGTREQCRGFCLVDSDCTPIFTEPEPEQSPQEIPVKCRGQACHYQYLHVENVRGERFTGLGSFVPTSEFPVNCTEENLELWTSTCNSKLVEDGGLSIKTIKECMVQEITCAEVPVIQDVPQAPDIVIRRIKVPVCHYYFWCSIPCVGVSQPLLVRSAKEKELASRLITGSNAARGSFDGPRVPFKTSAPNAGKRPIIVKDVPSVRTLPLESSSRQPVISGGIAMPPRGIRLPPKMPPSAA